MCVCMFHYFCYIRLILCSPFVWKSSLVSCFCVRSVQLCLTLCDPMDCGLPGSCVRGILQARILERAAIPSSRASGDQTQTQGWNPCLLHLLHWWASSLPLVHGIFVLIPLMPQQMACGVLVPWPGIGPEPLQWEHWVPDPRLPENSQPQGALISENCGKSLRLYTRAGITQLLAGLRAKILHLNSKQDKNTNATSGSQDYQGHPKHTASHIGGKTPKTHLPPPECKHKSLPTRSLCKTLAQPYH